MPSVRIVAIVAALLVTCGSAFAATYTIYAGATSSDGNWILRGYYPLTALTTPEFSIEEGDSIIFVVGGFAKSITISDRLFIPLVLSDGTFDPILTTPTGPSPISVTDATNDTYSSGLLPIGSNYTFTFPVAGTYKIFEIVQGAAVIPSLVVNPAGIPGPYSPVQIERYARDAMYADENLGHQQISAATAAPAAQTIALGFSTGSISYTGFSGGDPITVVIGTSLAFTNLDVRPLNVFVNSSGEFNVPANLVFGGPEFVNPSGESVGTAPAAVSSGLIYPGTTFSIIFDKLGDYTWHSTITGHSGNVTVVKAPPVLKPLSGGRAFAAFVVVVAILLLIFVIGCIVIMVCKQACMQAKKLEDKVSKSMGSLHLTDDL